MWFVELVRALAWPVTTGLVIFWLRPALAECLRSLATRKVAITAPGVSATLEAASQKEAGISPALSLPITQIVTLPPTPNPNVVAADLEKKIAEQLAETPPEYREPILIRHLANTRIQGRHEYVYNRIFGSQIAGLKRLNDVGRASMDEARIFAKIAIEENPEFYKDYGFNGWIDFLIKNSLVNKNEEFLHITDMGKDFLRYIIEFRLTEIKPF